MKNIFLFTILSSLFVLQANDSNQSVKEFEYIILEEEIKEQRHPTCDPHPYIYGSDEQGMWRSNGCSREYTSERPINHSPVQ